MKHWNDTRGGLSIIKTNENKIPTGKWKSFTEKQNTIDDWYNHYINGGSVGIICGSVSGNLEVIDIDTKNDPTNTIHREFGKLIPENIQNKLLVSTTPSGGFHFIYRCPNGVIEKSQDLAHHTDGAVIIETRGDSGYINHNKNYKFVKGGTINLKNLSVEIPEITPEERETLFTIARSLNRYFDRSKKGTSEEFKYDIECINQFNKEFDMIPFMVENEWEVIEDDGDKVSIKRPGDSSALHSAYYFRDSNLLYVHSTSTDFIPQKPYNNFQIIQTLLYKNGDNSFRKTLKKLKEYGYEEPENEKKKQITSEDILNELNKMNIYYEEFTQEYYYNDERISDVIENGILLKLRRIFQKEFPKRLLTEVLYSPFIRTKNYIKDYIKNNEHRMTTGVFDKWFEGIVTKENINREDLKSFVKKWYVGIIAQSLDGKNPNEFFLSLISNEHGIGKTYFFRNFILPKDLRKFQLESSISNDKDFKRQMSKNLLIIDDEMDGRTYQENATFKSLLSMDEMSIRLPYGKNETYLKRRCSFAGSGNEMDVIKEYSNRRIIPIEIVKFDIELLKSIDYDDLFMEMYYMFKKGEIYYFVSEDKDKLNNLFEDYKQQTDLDLIIDEMILFTDNPKELRFIKTIDMVKIMKEQYKDYRISSQTLGKFISRRGCKLTKKQVDGKRDTGYYIHKKSLIFEFVDFNPLKLNTITEKILNIN